MKAVIMAGGFGTRIHPLTINIPKPMVPLVNRPILLHIIDLLKRHGISEMVMVLFHQPQVIKNFFGNGAEFAQAEDQPAVSRKGTHWRAFLGLIGPETRATRS